MGMLELVLDKVKRADLEVFKAKVEKMESIAEQFKRDQGLQNIDDVIKERERDYEGKVFEVSSVTVHDNRIDDSPQLDKSSKDVSGEEIFNKFIQSIKG